MDNRFHIRPALPADAEMLSDLGMRTYISSHGPFIPSKEKLEEYVRNAHAIDTVKAELANPALHFFVAAYSSGGLIGYLKLRPCALNVPQKQPDDYEIQRLYIDEQVQGNGIGNALMQSAFTLLRSKGLRHVYLGVHEDNTKAIAFYEKLGGVKCSEHIFYVGDIGCVNPIFRIGF